MRNGELALKAFGGAAGLRRIWNHGEFTVQVV